MKRLTKTRAICENGLNMESLLQITIETVGQAVSRGWFLSSEECDYGAIDRKVMEKDF